MSDDQQSLFGDELLPMNPPSRVQERLIRSAVEIEADDPTTLLYQHTVFCQTGLPYRNPGHDAREWEKRNGNVLLRVEAGTAMNPETGEWVKLGLPYGPKPRLILTYLNREALVHGSPEIEVEDSLTAFAKRLLGYDPNGKEVRLLKDQLGCLAGAMVRLGLRRDGRAFQIDAKVVTAFDLWFPKDRRQRVLWPSIVRLSLDYFESLQRHAVPLDERAIAALSHSAMGLDIYCWLAQRLHRVSPFKPQFIPWTALKEQFGWHYSRMRKFREVFRQTLDMVASQYRGARIELDNQVMILRKSPPPIPGRFAVVRKP
jgi:Plasmid encoded RepA protein